MAVSASKSQNTFKKRLFILGKDLDPSEIIKAVPEIAKVVVPIAAAVPFTGIVKRMLGPAADELAELWKDRIRLYRGAAN